MGFFDELGKKISGASQEVVQKGKEMADTAKFNSMIHDEERKISAVYGKIGKKYFEDFQNAPAEGFKDFVDEIHVAEKAKDAAEKAKDAAEKAKDVASSTVEQVAEDAKSVGTETAAKVEEAAAKVEDAASDAADALSKE